MSVEALKKFLMWCTLLNAGLLLTSFLVSAFAMDWIHNMHGRWFPMQKETFAVVLYAYIAAYKLLVLVFNVVPWIALSIME